MQKHLIPNTDLNVSALCYGTASWGHEVVGRQLDRLLDAFRDAGGNFLDTAHCYACWTPQGAGVSERAIADYIRRHKLDENQAAYYRGNHQGAAWYVLMYGLYPSRKAALEGRDTLPAKIRKAKPWPRSLKAVHASIREQQ